jgi:hypothetical protein
MIVLNPLFSGIRYCQLREESLLPKLENRIRLLRRHFQRKDSEDTFRLRSAQLLDLGQAIMKYQNAR